MFSFRHKIKVAQILIGVIIRALYYNHIIRHVCMELFIVYLTNFTPKMPLTYYICTLELSGQTIDMVFNSIIIHIPRFIANYKVITLNYETFIIKIKCKLVSLKKKKKWKYLIGGHDLYKPKIIRHTIQTDFKMQFTFSTFSENCRHYPTDTPSCITVHGG